MSDPIKVVEGWAWSWPPGAVYVLPYETPGNGVPIYLSIVRRADYEALQAELARLRGALSDITPRFSEIIKDLGGCDHDVGICACADLRAVENARAALGSKP